MTMTTFSKHEMTMPPAGLAVTTPSGSVPRQIAVVGVMLMAASVQFSIAIAQIFMTLGLIGWVVLLAVERRHPRAPSWMLPLALYAGWTLLSAAVSSNPAVSLADC